jgi:hypothetical protein
MILILVTFPFSVNIGEFQLAEKIGGKLCFDFVVYIFKNSYGRNFAKSRHKRNQKKPKLFCDNALCRWISIKCYLALIQAESSTTNLWNAVGAVRTSTSHNRIVI